MGNYAIRMHFDIDAEIEAVRNLLSSTAGLSGWWSDRTDGSMDARGDEFTVTFPDAPAPFEFEVVSPGPDSFEWKVDLVPEWWAGTTVKFEVSAKKDSGTDLMFTHGGFEPDHPIVPIVTPAWALIVNNLKGVAETGVASAFFKSG